MNTLCNETLRIVVNAVTDDSIPTLRACSKEFKSMTCDRYISVQSKQIQEMYRELQKNVSNGTYASAVPTPQTIDDDYCPGCEAGVDCIGAHSDACNRQRGIY